MRLTYRTKLPDHTPETVFDWHERTGALERLTPPWADVEVLHCSGGIRDGGKVSLRIRRGPTSFRWDLRHRDFEYGRQFCDEQVAGLLRSWVHTHRFAPHGQGGTSVEDEIDLEPPLGAAVDDLLMSGFDRSEISVVVGRRRVGRDLAPRPTTRQRGHTSPRRRQHNMSEMARKPRRRPPLCPASATWARWQPCMR